jgi:hypothetical protein
MKVGDLKIEPIPGGLRASGTDPDLSMDDLADVMFEGFLHSEAKLRESGRSHFNTKEESMSEQGIAERELTYGEKAVGLNFNPSGDPGVDRIKRDCAKLIDMMDILRQDPAGGPEQKRLCSIAITELQGAQMWCVKAVTWRA